LEELSPILKDATRLVGLHFFNPVAQMPLVEIVRGKKTSETTMQQAAAITKSIRRLPLPVSSSPGFLVNRILMPYLMEAVVLAEEGILKQYNGDFQFDENINLVVVNGHTPAQQLVKVSDSSNTMFYCADLIPLASHILPPYIMGYDLNPLQTLNEKQKILPQAVEENWHLFFEHDPKIAAGTIKIGERGFTFDKTFEAI